MSSTIIRSNLQLYVELGTEDETSAELFLSRIETTTNLKRAVEGTEFVTEAVFEDLDLRRSL